MPDPAIPARPRPARDWLAGLQRGCDRLRDAGPAPRPGASSFDGQVFAQAAAAARIGVWECRLADERLTWTDTTYDLFGLPRGSPLRRCAVVECYAPGSRALLERVRGGALAAGTGFRLDAEITTHRGERRWIRITASLASAEGRPARLFGTKQDVTAERIEIGRLRVRAERDAMTGVANRAVFESRLAALEAGPAGGALLLVDLDGFKQVNDRFGHAIGDACLVEAAARLVRVCAAAAPCADPDAVLVARIGGDEFAVLLPPGLDRDAPERLAGRIVPALGVPVVRDGVELRLGASVGIARHVPGPGLFARADRALYAAKDAGRNTFRSFEALPCRVPGIVPGILPKLLPRLLPTPRAVPACAFVRLG